MDQAVLIEKIIDWSIYVNKSEKNKNKKELII